MTSDKIQEPYRQSIDDMAQTLKTSATKGLSSQQAQDRLKQDGPNVIPVKKPPWLLVIFLQQFASPLILFLLLAAVIIYFTSSEWHDAFVVLGVLLFNAAIGTFHARKAYNVLASLVRFVRRKVIVIRDGRDEVIDADQLVVGDLIELQAGEVVPADARIVEVHNLFVDESVLTGESQPVSKIDDRITKQVPLAEQANMVFSGTNVTSGSAYALVVATADQTYIGAIGRTIQDVETKAPLESDIQKLSYGIVVVIAILCAVLFVLGFAEGRPMHELFATLAALFICVIPEGLPIVVTLLLATVAYQMARYRVLVRNLSSMESVGRADVIVVDKTGTLTRNELMISAIATKDGYWQVTGSGYQSNGEIKGTGSVEENELLQQLGRISALTSDVHLTKRGSTGAFDLVGDPIEAAFMILVQKLRLDHDMLKQSYREIEVFPFDVDLRYRASFFEHDGALHAFIIGSPEAIFERSQTKDSFWQQALDRLVDEGLRVIAVGVKHADKSYLDTIESLSDNEREKRLREFVDDDIEIIALCGLQDAIRPNVADLVQQVRNTGTQVVMATGDHLGTAQYVASKTGLLCENDTVINGEQFDQLSDEEIISGLDSTTVYSRMTPSSKERLVTLMRQQGNVVAVAGDGVNDAPALVVADVGIAMGGTGSHVAREVADMVLLDDSFEHIVQAIIFGRYILSSLRRVILYFFATNSMEVVLVLLAFIINVELPITAPQILWLNLVTDGFLDMALAMEPVQYELTRFKKQTLLNKELLLRAAFMGLIMGISSLFVFLHYRGISIAYARTMTLLTLALSQWMNAWNYRSESKSLFSLNPFANHWLLAATVFVLLLQVMVIYVPFVGYLFDTVPVHLADWGVALLVACATVVGEECYKWVRRRYIVGE